VAARQRRIQAAVCAAISRFCSRRKAKYFARRSPSSGAAPAPAPRCETEAGALASASVSPIARSRACQPRIFPVQGSSAAGGAK
jgi:hypothetical protein